ASHADEDRKKREAVDARNQLDGLVYQTEKTLADHGAALDASTKGDIETALADAKKALESQDAATLKAAADTLAGASHKLAEAVYSKASKPGGDGAGAEAGAGGEEPKKPKDDVVEAEFEEVKE